MFKRLSRRMALGLGVMALCATATAAQPTPDRTLVTAQQITEKGYSSVLDGLDILRTRGVIVRPISTLLGDRGSDPVLYLDGMRLSSIDLLRVMHPAELDSMRYLGEQEANLRYGGSHPAGAIVVHTLRR